MSLKFPINTVMVVAIIKCSVFRFTQILLCIGRFGQEKTFWTIDRNAQWRCMCHCLFLRQRVCVYVLVCVRGCLGCGSSSFGDIISDRTTKEERGWKKLFPHKLFSFFYASGPVEQLMKFKWSRIRRSSMQEPGLMVSARPPARGEIETGGTADLDEIKWKRTAERPGGKEWVKGGGGEWDKGMKYPLNVIISNHL